MRRDQVTHARPMESSTVRRGETNDATVARPPDYLRSAFGSYVRLSQRRHSWRLQLRPFSVMSSRRSACCCGALQFLRLALLDGGFESICSERFSFALGESGGNALFCAGSLLASSTLPLYGRASVVATLLRGPCRSCDQKIDPKKQNVANRPRLALHYSTFKKLQQHPPAIEGITSTSSPSWNAYLSFPRNRMSSSLT